MMQNQELENAKENKRVRVEMRSFVLALRTYPKHAASNRRMSFEQYWESLLREETRRF